MNIKEIFKELPSTIFVPRFSLNTLKKLIPIQYDLIIFAYRKEIGYYHIRCSNQGTISITDTLISFYDDDLINSANNIKNFLISEHLLEQ